MSGSSDEHPPPVLRRSIAAVALPALLIVAAQSQTVWTWFDRAGSSHAFAIVMVSAAIGLAVLECRWLITLSYLVRARGRVAQAAAMMHAPIARRARRRWLMGAAASFLSVVFALLAAELVFVVLDIRPDPPPPRQSADAEAVDNTLNVLGMRERWDAIDPQDGRLRIAMLGDSFTYGEGVERKEAFCHLVGEQLSQAVPGGVLTMNLGYPGTAPADQLVLYRELAPALTPAYVVHVLYLNDLEDVHTHAALERIYALRDGDVWLRGSRVLHYAQKQVRYRLAMRETLDFYRGGRRSAEREAAWQRLAADVAAVKAAVEEGGAVYCLVLHPWLFRLSDYPLEAEHERMARLAARMGVEFLDLLELFRGRDARALRISDVNEHPNAAAHAMTAERLTRFLLDEVLRPGAAPSEP